MLQRFLAKARKREIRLIPALNLQRRVELLDQDLRFQVLIVRAAGKECAVAEIDDVVRRGDIFKEFSYVKVVFSGAAADGVEAVPVIREDAGGEVVLGVRF